MGQREIFKDIIRTWELFMQIEERIECIAQKKYKDALSLYIHIPFCKAKCNYCDFNSFAGREVDIPAYFDALKIEIEGYKEKLQDYELRTIFIGGGTPSLVETKYIYEILDLLNNSFNIANNAEISMESNPGTLLYEKLLSYKSMGINRLSMGLQAWQERLLKSLGRIHSAEEFVENFNLAKKVGFENINVDLIFGLPSQTLKDWLKTLRKVIELQPSHISCYSLKIEDGTVMGSQLYKGEIDAPDEALDRNMYYAAIDILGKKGYKQYEISNFARVGYECKHNLVYWRAEQYIGIGAGAHSYINGERFNNVSIPDKYIESVLKNQNKIENVEKIDLAGQISEFIILGLRLNEGISRNKFKELFDKDIFDVYGSKIEQLFKKGLLNMDGDKLMLTSSGLDYANQVFVEFI